MSSEPESRSFTESITSNRTALFFGIIAIIALALVCVLSIALLRPFATDDDGGTGGEPTPFPTAGSGQSIFSSNEPLVVGISGSDTISVAVDVPIQLDIAGRLIPVRTEAVSGEGAWQAAGDEGSATWVYGTIINYVLGLPDSSESETLLNQLGPGEEMVLSTRGGRTFTFTFNSREMVSAGSKAVFAQNRPGITLILLGASGEDRLVVKGRYVVPEATSSGQGQVVGLGETAQLDDLQVTVTGASHVLDRPEAPPGFAFYMVDFELQNVGLTALDTNLLQLLLMDELGNQYALSPVASQLGNHPPLGGFLNSNQAGSATAGYQIPIGLNSSALNWVVTREDTRAQVQVTIPFGRGTGAGRGTSVSLLRAEVSADLTSLILAGQIINLDEQAMLVTEGDISLKTADGSVYLMLSTNPPFPWAVAGNQSVQFQVSFQRPPATDTAVFTVVNQPFELSGLR